MRLQVDDEPWESDDIFELKLRVSIFLQGIYGKWVKVTVNCVRTKADILRLWHINHIIYDMITIIKIIFLLMP